MVQTQPSRIHVLAKPTGAICNLNCSYCFFLDKEQLYPDRPFACPIRCWKPISASSSKATAPLRYTVAWQGGEPTLMGIDFYRKAIALQEKYRKPGMTFENTMQTNGTPAKRRVV
jgi:uncharacterized protein